MTTPRPNPAMVFGSCRVVRVVGGDTVDIEIVRRCRVRLADCWAPETRRTDHPTEKKLGSQAKQELSGHIQPGDECTVEFVSDGDDVFGDDMTFGRFVGNVWVHNDISVSDFMRETGLAFKTKQELEAFLTQQDNEQATRNFEEL